MSKGGLGRDKERELDIFMQWLKDVDKKRSQETRELEMEMARYTRQNEEKIRWRGGIAEALEEIIILLKDNRELLKEISGKL